MTVVAGRRFDRGDDLGLDVLGQGRRGEPRLASHVGHEHVRLGFAAGIDEASHISLVRIGILGIVLQPLGDECSLIGPATLRLEVVGPSFVEEIALAGRPVRAPLSPVVHDRSGQRGLEHLVARVELALLDEPAGQHTVVVVLGGVVPHEFAEHGQLLGIAAGALQQSLVAFAPQPRALDVLRQAGIGGFHSIENRQLLFVREVRAGNVLHPLEERPLAEPSLGGQLRRLGQHELPQLFVPPALFEEPEFHPDGERLLGDERLDAGQLRVGFGPFLIGGEAGQEHQPIFERRLAAGDCLFSRIEPGQRQIHLHSRRSRRELGLE